MKLNKCCHKWRDISNGLFTISHPGIDEYGKKQPLCFDKRKIHYCPECGNQNITFLEGFKRWFESLTK